MDILMNNKKGITLKTANKFIPEDIHVSLSENILNITIASVSDLVVSDNLVISWTSPDLTDVESYEPIISYVVNINGTEYETNETSLDASELIGKGETTISVKVKAVLPKVGADNVVAYSPPASYTIETLSVKFPRYKYSTSAVAIGSNAYIFGGESGDLDAIYKFDSVAETITTLSVKLPTGTSDTSAVAIGSNAYIFGGKSTYLDTIVKFDSINETITTLSAKLPQVLHSTSAVAIGSNAYIFGGSYGNSDDYSVDIIQKFDSITETITTLSATLPKILNKTSAVGINDNIYIFGGASELSNRNNSIYCFNCINETTETLEVTLPSSRYSTSAVAIGSNAYIFGGYSSTYLDTIVKFDSINETTETLEVTLPSVRSKTSAVAIGSNAYIFGGYNPTYLNTIYKFTV